MKPETLKEEIDHYLLTLEQVNMIFNDELQRQIDVVDKMSVEHIYNLGCPGRILRSIGVPDCPIELKSSILYIKANDPNHTFQLENVKNLPLAINDPLAVFSYGDPQKMINIITEIEYNEKKFLVGLSLRPVVNSNTLQINSVRNVFPKDTLEWINWINKGKGLYFNKEKVLNLLDQPQIDPARRGFRLTFDKTEGATRRPKTYSLTLSQNDIDSAINIVKIFKNPIINEVSDPIINNINDSTEKSKKKNNFF